MAVCDAVDTAPHPQLMRSFNSRLADQWSIHKEPREQVEADDPEPMSMLRRSPHVLAVEVVHCDDVAAASQVSPPQLQLACVTPMFGFRHSTDPAIFGGRTVSEQVLCGEGISLPVGSCFAQRWRSDDGVWRNRYACGLFRPILISPTVVRIGGSSSRLLARPIRRGW